MKRSAKVIVAACLALFIFTIFVPVLRFDTNVRPECVNNRIPCPLTISSPITGHAVYWSITAYYLGWGTYFVTFTVYGFV